MFFKKRVPRRGGVCFLIKVLHRVNIILNDSLSNPYTLYSETSKRTFKLCIKDKEVECQSQNLCGCVKTYRGCFSLSGENSTETSFPEVNGLKSLHSPSRHFPLLYYSARINIPLAYVTNIPKVTSNFVKNILLYFTS